MSVDNMKVRGFPAELGGAMSPSAPRMIAFALLVLASAVAGIGAATPDMWGAWALGLGTILTCSFLLLYPRAAVVMSFFLLALATTKFRDREATALLAGDIDTQVIFEMVSYGVVLLVVLLNALIFLSPRQKRKVPLGRMELFLGAYVILAAVSVLWSADRFVTAPRAFQLLILYALALVAVRVLAPRQLMRTLTVSVVVYVLLASLMAALFPWARLPGDSFSWFQVHPGIAAAFAAAAAILLLAEVLFGDEVRNRGIKRILLCLLIAVFVLVLVAAHERSPIFAFAAAALTMWTRKYLRPWQVGLVLTGVLIVSNTGFHAIASLDIGARSAPQSENPVTTYLLRGQSSEQFLGLTGRVELWDYVYSLIRERPLLGYGYLSSRSVLLERFPWAGGAHGALPEVLLNLGLAGTFLLGFVVVSTLVSALVRPLSSLGGRAWSRASILGILVFFLVASFAGEGFAGPPSYLLFLFLLAVALHEHVGAGSRSENVGSVGGG